MKFNFFHSQIFPPILIKFSMTKNALIEELKHLSNTFGLLARSQIGYDLRQLEKPIRDRMLQAAVGGGKVIRVDGADKRFIIFTF